MILNGKMVAILFGFWMIEVHIWNGIQNWNIMAAILLKTNQKQTKTECHSKTEQTPTIQNQKHVWYSSPYCI